MSTFISDIETIHHLNMFMKFRPPTHTPLYMVKLGFARVFFLYVFFLSVFFPFFIALHPRSIFMGAKLFIGVPLR